MTLQERHKIELERALKSQLGVTVEELKVWKTGRYPADGRTVSKFWKEIEEAECVRIVGDYDCDGICAQHILSQAIKSLYPGKRVSVRTPRRFSEGYGINETIAQEIRESLPKGSLVITVDNGIAAADVLEGLAKDGYRVIVTDHHELRPGCRVPNVDMVIDPAVEEIYNPLDGRYWCGAAVVFKLCEPMIREDLAKDLEVYAGLATVADCVPLREGNWGVVRRAISAFRKKSAPVALRQLLVALGQDPDFANEDSFGFYLGPVFNAPGRLEDRGAVEVLRYLANPTTDQCAKLVKINERRREIRDEEYEIVKGELVRSGHANDCPLWVHAPGLHEGVVGILAGKLAEEFKRPAVVLTTREDGNYVGSARSYGDFNIFEYLSSIDNFLRMGGHPGAAGLSMTPEAFLEARKHQVSPDQFAAKQETGERMAIRLWEIPGLKAVEDKFAPFGEGNPRPRFEVEVDLEKDGGWLLGAHLFIMDKGGRFKLTKFNHVPNELNDKNHFVISGVIIGNAFHGVETPTFNGEECSDIVDAKELSR